MNGNNFPVLTRALACWSVALLCALTGCHANAPRVAATPEPSSDVAARHVVRSTELREIMRRLESLMYDRVQSDLALDAARIKAAEKLAAAADELAAVATAIPVAGATATLNDAERQRFSGFARDLAAEAKILSETAAGRQFVQSAAQFERMSHACAGCHNLYRAR